MVSGWRRSSNLREDVVHGGEGSGDGCVAMTEMQAERREKGERGARGGSRGGTEGSRGPAQRKGGKKRGGTEVR